MKNVKLIIITSLLLVGLVGCMASKTMDAAKIKFTEENDAIPPSFGSENTTLLCIIKDRGSYDRYLKAATTQYYFGDYEFVNFYQMNKDKYNDTKKYRYFFDYGAGTTVEYSTGGSSTIKKFFVQDRLEDKQYTNGAQFGNFGVALKAYMQNLELKRLSYKK